MKPKNVSANTYTEYSNGVNRENLRFSIGNYIRISKTKNSFAKVYVPNQDEEVKNNHHSFEHI